MILIYTHQVNTILSKYCQEPRPCTVQWRTDSSLQLNVYMRYACQEARIHVLWKLYMTPVRSRKWLFSVSQFPCSTMPWFPFCHRRQTEDHRVSSVFLTSSSAILSRFTLACSLVNLPMFLFLSLLFLPVFSPSRSVASCPILFSFLSFFLPSTSVSSARLLLRDRSTPKYRLLAVALCSPHLDHIILKSEGTARLLSMRACSRRGESGRKNILKKKKNGREQERGKRCHPQPSQRDECSLTKSPL